MKKNANKLFLAAGLLAMSAVLLTGCGSKKKTDAADSVIKISTAPEPTATPDPEKVDPDAVISNGNLTMVNEYLAENGGAALGSAAVTPTPAASDGSSGDSGTDASDGDTANTDTSDGDSSDENGTDSSEDDDSSYDGGDAGYSDESGYDDSSYDDGSEDGGSDSYDDTGEGDYDGE